MPKGADDLIFELQRLKTGSGYTVDLLPKARRAVGQRPGERYSRQALARAEIKLGDRDKGEKLLAVLLDEDAGNLEALRLMGMSKLQRAAADPAHRSQLQALAREYLVRADKSEPNDYATLFLLAQTMATDGPPSPERLALLRRAVSLAPEVARIRIVAAATFMTAGDNRTAYQLLKPISVDPNGGIAAYQAQQLLAQLEGAKAEATPAPPR